MVEQPGRALTIFNIFQGLFSSAAEMIGGQKIIQLSVLTADCGSSENESVASEGFFFLSGMTGSGFRRFGRGSLTTTAPYSVIVTRYTQGWQANIIS